MLLALTDFMICQVAQGRSINTINRNAGKEIAKQLAKQEDDMSRVTEMPTLPSESGQPSIYSSSSTSDKKKKRGFQFGLEKLP